MPEIFQIFLYGRKFFFGVVIFSLKKASRVFHLLGNAFRGRGVCDFVTVQTNEIFLYEKFVTKRGGNLNQRGGVITTPPPWLCPCTHLYTFWWKTRREHSKVFQKYPS